MRLVVLHLLGVPIPFIILIALFGHHFWNLCRREGAAETHCSMPHGKPRHKSSTMPLMIDVINHFEFRDGNRVLRNRAALSAATSKAEGQRSIGGSSLDDLHAGTAFLKNPTVRLLDTF
jgi:hypothetical protein